MAEENKDLAAAEAVAPAESAAPATEKRKKTGRHVPSGIAFVHATFNNTKVTFTDLHGNVLCWFKGDCTIEVIRKLGTPSIQDSTPFFGLNVYNSRAM